MWSRLPCQDDQWSLLFGDTDLCPHRNELRKGGHCEQPNSSARVNGEMVINKGEGYAMYLGAFIAADSNSLAKSFLFHICDTARFPFRVRPFAAVKPRGWWLWNSARSKSIPARYRLEYRHPYLLMRVPYVPCTTSHACKECPYTLTAKSALLRSQCIN